MENVITLVITGASDGSKNPLRPSSRLSVPPVISPSMGFERLMFLRCPSPRSSYPGALVAAEAAPYLCVA